MARSPEYKITIINNNYYGNTNCETNDDIVYMSIQDDNVKIFDNSENNKLLLYGLQGSGFESAELIIKLTKGSHCYCKGNWYHFENHRWIIKDAMNKYISKDFASYYEQLYMYYIKKGDEKKSEFIRKHYFKLKSKTKKEEIKYDLIKEYEAEYPDFVNLLDSKPYLIGFNNGVFDLHEMKFRNGQPEDMISMTCGYDFNAKYSDNKKNLIKFLKDIIPNDDDRKFLLTYYATGLIGKNLEEIFVILTGTGRNGKSKICELIKLTFGDYFGNPKCKLLTGSRPDENSPEPGLLGLKKKRLVIVSEPEARDKINSGFIKFITGNDTSYLRKCHENELENFKANFITSMICNNIPEFDEIDNAIIKRLRCIHFPTEFTDNPKLPHQKKIIKELPIDNWKNDFFLLLLEHYNDYKTNGLITTENIMKWSNEYKEESDKYFTFLTETTEESDLNISSALLWEVFKDWYKLKYPNNKDMPNNREFSNGIKKYKNIEKSVRVGDKVTSGIKNLKLKNNYIDD